MLVTVANFTVPWEAHMFRTRLLAEDIYAFVVHEQHVANDGTIATGLGGVKVQVVAEDAAAARAVERDAIAGRYRAELDAAFGQDPERCPNCGSTEFKTKPQMRHRVLAMAVAVFGGVSLPAVAEAMRECRRCRWEWRRQLPD